MRGPSREAFRHLRDESVRRIVASEKAVERQFQDARLVASLAIALALVGFLLVAQWRGVGIYSADLETHTDQELADLVSQLGAENDELRREMLRLEMQLAEAERTGEGQEALLNQAILEMQNLRVVAGIEEAQGPGVALRISDPENVLLAQDFVTVVNELKSAGAEAISVDGTRIGPTTGFSDDAGRIRVDESFVTREAEVLAIGDPDTLEQAILMQGGVSSTLGAFPGVTLSVYERDDIRVSAAAITAMVAGEPRHE